MAHQVHGCEEGGDSTGGDLHCAIVLVGGGPPPSCASRGGGQPPHLIAPTESKIEKLAFVFLGYGRMGDILRMLETIFRVLFMNPAHWLGVLPQRPGETKGRQSSGGHIPPFKTLKYSEGISCQKPPWKFQLASCRQAALQVPPP